MTDLTPLDRAPALRDRELSATAWDRTAPTVTQALRCAAHNQQGCTQ